MTAAPGTPARWVETADARLAVYSGGGGGDPIVFLHGGPGVPDYLAPVADLLATSHRVIRYDQRGAGASTTSSGRYDLSSHVDDLEAIRTALGHDRLGLFGHSWGGTLAQLYAKRHPERVARIFLSNSGIGLGEDWRRMERAVMAHNRRRGGLAGFSRLGLYQVVSMLPGAMGDSGAASLMGLVWRNYFDPPSSAPAPDPGWLTGVRAKAIHLTRRAALDANASELGALRLTPGTPILVLFGSEDIYGTTTKVLFDRFPNARHVELEGCGHVPWLQSPEAFRRELCGFFGC